MPEQLQNKEQEIRNMRKRRAPLSPLPAVSLPLAATAAAAVLILMLFSAGDKLSDDDVSDVTAFFPLR